MADDNDIKKSTISINPLQDALSSNDPSTMGAMGIARSGKKIGNYLAESSPVKEAEKALEGLNTNGIDILGAGNSEAAQSPSEVAQVKKTIWDGVFVPSDKGQMGPDFNTEFQDARYYFPSKATYENDGKPAAGYGNSSSNNHTP